jgi:hypothetical protein
MRELRLVSHPASAHDRAAWPLSRNAFITSVLVHLAGAYIVGRMVFSVELPLVPEAPRAEIIWLGARTPPPQAPPAAEPPSAAVAPQPPPAVEVPSNAEPPVPPQAQRAVPQRQPVAPEPAPVAPVEEAEPAAVAPRPVAPGIDFAAERRRAAAEVIGERADDSYLTFSVDEAAPPRPTPEPKPKRSIFDGAGGSGGPSVGQLGQQRTRFGRKAAELCNALTGGFGVAFQGLGLFRACERPDDEPSGLFPEVRPEYLDLLPECAESQPENPELAAAAPFSTVKCRLVRPVEIERWAYPGKPPAPP